MRNLVGKIKQRNVSRWTEREKRKYTNAVMEAVRQAKTKAEKDNGTQPVQQ